MKLNHKLAHSASRAIKLFKKKYSLFSVLFLVVLLVGTFFISRGVNPHTSELSYIEYSSIGKDAGSVIPASCDSATPFNSPTAAGGTAGSHFNGDCVTTCPSGTGTYDPYFNPSAAGCASTCPGGVGTYVPASDPSQTACPAPSVSMSNTPGTVAYNTGYTSLTLTSSGASACYLNYLWAGGVETGAGAVPTNNVWGASGPLTNTLSYRAYCYNGATNYTYSNWTTIYVKPSIPTSPTATCNNAAGTSTTLSWGASLNSNAGYYLRVDYPVAQSCPSGWQKISGTCYPNPDTYVSTSYSFTTLPDQSYTWRTYGRNSYTNSSSTGSTFTCYQATGYVMVSTTTPSTCTILPGGNSCQVNIDWGTTRPFQTSVISRSNPTRTDYTQNTGTSLPVTVYGPPASSNTTISLKNGNLTLASVQVDAVCQAGSSWSGGVCAPSSATISAPSCTIPRLSSTCNTNVSWTSSNLSSTLSVKQDGTEFSTLSSSGGVLRVITYGSSATNTFTIEQSGIVLDSVTATGLCEVGTVWNSSAGKCTPTAVNRPDLNAAAAEPSTAIPGTTNTLTANITNTGTFTTGASFSNFFRVADQANGGGSIIGLAPTTMSALAIGASTTASKTYAFPSGPGTYSVQVCSDQTSYNTGGVITESDETNNCGSPWTNVTVSCGAGVWNGTSCGVASAVLTVPTCTIALNASICSSNVSWTSSNITPPLSVKQAGTQFSTLSSSGGVPRNLTYGFDSANIFRIEQAGVLLHTVTGSGSCIAGTVWDGSKCAASALNLPNLVASAATPATAIPGTNNTLSAVISNTGTADTPATFSNFFQVAPQAGGGGTVVDDTPASTAILVAGASRTINKTYTFPSGPGTYSIRLCTDKTSSGNSGVIAEIDENDNCGSPWTTVTVACGGVDKWDSINKVCADPTVDSPVTVVGLYYPPGSISFSCTNSTHYAILKDGATFTAKTPYTVPITFAVTLEGQYVIECYHGDAKDTAPVYYSATPGTPEVVLKITPTTIAPDQTVTVKWETKFPTNACALTAKVVCANNACSAAQTAEEVALNAILNATTTDANDPAGASRDLQTAVKQVAPGHKDSSTPIVNVDWKALGKKTLRLKFTTDLIYDCGAGNKETKRIQVTKSELQ